MCLEAVDKVLKDPILLRLFNIPSDLWPAMRHSWGLKPNINAQGKEEYIDDPNADKQRDFLGRFDWSWDGVDLKLLEYNADTPSLLLESGAVSKDWLIGMNAAHNSQVNFLD